jgi:hypothetical protein
MDSSMVTAAIFIIIIYAVRADDDGIYFLPNERIVSAPECFVRCILKGYIFYLSSAMSALTI